MEVENPLAGWPPTEPIEGEDGYRVRARHFTPEGAGWAEMLTGMVLAVAIIVFIFAALDGAFSAEQFFGTAAALAVVGGVLWAAKYRLLKPLFGKTARIEVRPDVIRLGQRFGRYKNYDRQLPHTFDYTIHDMAEWEAEQEAIEQHKAAMQRRSAKAARHFRKSYHIILRYAGQRVDVASVFGKKDAEALLTRLQLLDSMMDAAAGDMAAHVRPEPAMQYGRRPEAG